VRNIFFNLLLQQMREDRSMFLLIADVGLGLVDPIQKEFPDRFLNVGIAEQNMIGIAAGLCNAGFKPVCYTLSNFLIHRCLEQIRNDICLHEYPVTLVGTSTGYDNGILGPTHHVIDDIGCLKVFPNIRIYSPGSDKGIYRVFEEIFQNNAPAYVRIGKGNLHVNNDCRGVNHMITNCPDSSLLVITHGNILENCIKAADKDNKYSLFCMNKIKPLNSKELDELFTEYNNILVVEDQFPGSGLFNILCQYIVEMGSNTVRMYSLAPKERYDERIGDKNYFSSYYGLSPDGISKKASEILEF